jgi:replicative DNA helicase
MTEQTKAGNGAAKPPDENDQLKDGTLPKDPKADTKTVAGQDIPRVLTVQQILKASMLRAESAKTRAFCTTGNWFIDDATGGMQPGDCWLFGADTSWGKSSWAIMIVDVNLHAGKRVLIVSSEDSEELYGDRLMCRRAGVDAKLYRNGTLSEAEWKAVRETVAKGEPVPVFVDARAHRIEKLAPHLDKIIQQQAIDMVIFDYLQEFQSARRHQDERIKFKEIAAVMRKVVKLNKKTGIIMSQLTITSTKKYPDRNSIRESRDVSNAAETILIGYIPEEHIYVKDDDNKDTEEILIEKGTRVTLIDKCKKGPRGGKFPMPWDDRTAAFTEVKDPEQQRIDNMAAQYSDLADNDNEE